MQFSAPVVVSGPGSPALKLETGLIDREAVWINASSTASIAYVDNALVEEVRADASLLLFEYTVVTGDKAHDLDYWCDEEVKNMYAQLMLALDVSMKRPLRATHANVP